MFPNELQECAESRGRLGWRYALSREDAEDIRDVGLLPVWPQTDGVSGVPVDDDEMTEE